MKNRYLKVLRTLLTILIINIYNIYDYEKDAFFKDDESYAYMRDFVNVNHHCMQ